MVKCLPAMWETRVPSLGWEDPLAEGMATHCSVLAWRIPWTEEPGGLQDVGCKESNTAEQLHFHFYFPLCPISISKNPVQVGRASLTIKQTVEHSY